jgi:hypothetical protein
MLHAMLASTASTAVSQATVPADACAEMLLRRTLPVFVTWIFLQVNSSPADHKHIIVLAEGSGYPQSWQKGASQGKLDRQRLLCARQHAHEDPTAVSSAERCNFGIRIADKKCHGGIIPG